MSLPSMNLERIAARMNCSDASREPRRPAYGSFRGRILVRVGLLFVVLVGVAGEANAQIVPRPAQRVIQLGLAGLPGAGAVAGYVAPRGVYTVGAMLYADATPSFSGGEGSLLVSLGLGGSIRPLGIVRMIANAGSSGYDVDLGVRVGQSLFFPYGESSRERNPFSLFIEPFVRVESTFGGERTLFLELGLQRPILRGGLWLSF